MILEADDGLIKNNLRIYIHIHIHIHTHTHIFGYNDDWMDDQ